MRLAAAFVGACLFAGVPATAEVTVHALFSDHAVLQRATAVPVWGTAAPGVVVTVGFAGQVRRATADASGNWRVVLDAMPASAEPRELTVSSGSDRLVRTDVVVGEVWLASGQSNMRSPLFAAHNADQVLPHAVDSGLRFFTVPLRTAVEPQRHVSAAWTPTTPEAARDFSAVAYFFASELRRTLGVPVGVIAAASWRIPLIRDPAKGEAPMKSPALKAGLIGAGIVLLLNLIGIVPVIGCIGLPLEMIAYVAIGAMAAFWIALRREVGRAAGQGALAGLIAGAASGILRAILTPLSMQLSGGTSAILSQVPAESLRQLEQAGIDPNVIFGGGTMAGLMLVCCLPLGLLLGAGLARLGGVIFAAAKPE